MSDNEIKLDNNDDNEKVEDAVRVIDGVLAKLQMTRQDHIVCSNSLELLHKKALN